MKTLLLLFLVIGLGVLGSSCVSSAPRSAAALHDAVGRGVPAEASPLAIVAAGNWFPNTQGYGALKSITPSSQVGVIAISKTRICFLQWSAPQGRFNVIKVLSYIDARQVFLEKLGRGRMLVVQSQDYTFDSFEFTGGSGIYVDADKAESAYSFIESERKGVNQAPEPTRASAVTFGK